MKIVFRNLPEGEGTVKVSLDGGNTFIDHQINTVRENGIPLVDSQDYSKILIKGSANILRNLDILSSVKVDGAAQNTGTTYKAYTWEQSDQVIYIKDGSNVVYKKTPDNTVEELDRVYELTEDNGLERIRLENHKGYWYKTPDLDFTVNEQTVGIPYTYEKPVYGLGTVTYKCYAYDQNTDGQITDDDDMPNYYQLWVKTIDGKDTVYGIESSGLTTDVSNLVEISKLTVPPPSDMLTNITINENLIILGPGRYIRYPEGDLTNEEETVVGTETVTETIKFIQDPPTVTENGTVVADEGKAFKSANVEVPKSELGFKCFYNYAPSHYFGNVPIASQALDSGTRNYNILMSNNYLIRMYKNAFPELEYNGLVGIVNDSGNESTFTRVYDTSAQEYNLFQLDTIVGSQRVRLVFYNSREPKNIERILYVQLDNGELFPTR